MSKVTCPYCNSTETIPIIYGYPTPDSMDDMLEADRKGKIKMGGDVAQDGLSTDHCKNKKSKREPTRDGACLL